MPCCQGNYDSQGPEGRVSVFKFPKSSDLRNMWIRKINRQDFTPSSNAFVFAAHFSPEALITEDTITKPDGSTFNGEEVPCIAR